MATTSTTGSSHLSYLANALSLARQSPPKPSNFRVGAILISHVRFPSSEPNSLITSVISTGYTLELPGNTHAEQSCLTKLAQRHSIPESELYTILPPAADCLLYTTLEPCGERLSGNTPCVQRIIATRGPDGSGGIRKVIFGAKEPGIFVQDSQSCRTLTEAGVEWEYIGDMEKEILKVAMEGHVKNDEVKEQRGKNEVKGKDGTNVDDISTEDRRRQEEMPRNPKKRMMETV